MSKNVQQLAIIAYLTGIHTEEIFPISIDHLVISALVISARGGSETVSARIEIAQMFLL